MRTRYEKKERTRGNRQRKGKDGTKNGRIKVREEEK
jgi:hypothetical protein